MWSRYSVLESRTGMLSLCVGACALLVVSCSTSVPNQAARAAAGDPNAGPESPSLSPDGMASGTASTPGTIPTGNPSGAGAGSCTPLAAIPRRIWRLSNQQYSNSVRDVLKLSAGPAVSGGGTSEFAFFSGDLERVDDALAFSYWQASAKSSAGAIAIPGFSTCMQGEAEPACGERMLTALAARAFRRPLAAEETTALLAVFNQGVKKSFSHGLTLGIQAILQAPSFVYRSELGSATTATSKLTPFETAGQFAYLLLDSLPDEPLWAAAQAGALATPAELGVQFERLAQLPQAQANITRIVEEWFGTRRGAAAQKDAVQFPEWNTAMSAALVESTNRLIDDTLWNGARPLEELITSRRMFVNQKLGAYYGFDSATLTDQFAALEFPAIQPRAGLLTYPTQLAAVSGVGKTSVVHRGIYVRKEIICADPVPGPPPGLLSDPTIKDALAQVPTERAAANYRQTNTVCAGCHALIDPYGSLFENFDPVGRYRDIADGQRVDASASLSVSPSLMGKVNGAVPLGQGLAQDNVFSACAVRKLTSYALGRTVTTSNTCELNNIQTAYLASDHSMRALLREIVSANFLQTRGGTP